MTFTAWPPSVMIPWTRAESRSCWRSGPTFTKAATMASRALSPASGRAAAWAALPWYSTFSSRQASAKLTATSRLPGWAIIAQVSPWNAPRAAMYTLPPAASSAGVPITSTVPPVSPATAFAARPAVADARQGVVLRQEGHPRLAFAVAGAKGGRQLADASLHGEALALQVIGEPGGSLLLLKGDLRVGVDLETDRDELVAAAVHLGDHLLLQPG